MRRALSVLIALALAVAPAAAAAPVKLGDGAALALAASDAYVYAVVESGDPDQPFDVVRTTGRGASAIGSFGVPGAEYPSVAVGAAGVSVAWSRLGSSGFAYSVASTAALDSPEDFGMGTGPPRLAIAGERRVVAFPDRAGDVALAGAIPGSAPETFALTDSAPQWRHLPLTLVTGKERRVYVLDLVQTQTRSELRVLGLDAPAGAVVGVNALRGINATLVVDGTRAYVAYLSRGRAVLATAPLQAGATWTRRMLPGPGGGTGQPALVRAGGVTTVAYAQRVRRNSEIYAWSAGRLRRVTTDPGADTDPLAAATGDGTVYVSWTRTPKRPAQAVALLQRLD